MKALTPVEAQWIFPRSALDQTPSRDGGISLEEELKRRKAVIEYVESLALRTGSADDPDATRVRKIMIIASTLVHRFYMRRSFEDFKEKLMAPTILFLASKIDEEALKLRYIVNACLSKWDKQENLWLPDKHNKDNYPSQSREYQAWERDILAAEELTLDALCFDMVIESPREIIDEALRGVTSSVSSRLSEGNIVSQAMYLLHDSLNSPLSILYHPKIIAFGITAIGITILENIYLQQGLTALSELSHRFELDLAYSENGLVGQDAPLVHSFCEDYIHFAKMQIIDYRVLEYVDTDTTDLVYTRYFPDAKNGTKVSHQHTNGHAKA